MSNFWLDDATDVAKHFGVNLRVGLTDAQVEASRAKHGRNEIPKPEGTPLWKLILKQFEDLLVLILLGAACISLVLAIFDDSHDRTTAFVEPAVILVILILNATVGVMQESNAESAIEKLKESEALHATVIRNGKQADIEAVDLVPGDVVIIKVGDKVPADSRLFEVRSSQMLADQAALTGESEGINKIKEPVAKKAKGVYMNQDKINILFSGSLITRGVGSAIVTLTGQYTELGKIAMDLAKKGKSDDDDDKEEDKTPLQKKLDEFGEQLSKVIAVICIVVWLININHFFDPEHGNAFKGAIYYFKIAVALAVAAIPEGLPAVVTTCLALGTLEMAKKNAIVRSLPSVETLGCTSVICSDKTGTLTTNKMSVQKVLIPKAKTGNSVSFAEFDVFGDSWAPSGDIKLNGKVVSSPAVSEGGLAEVGKACSLCNEATLGFEVKAIDNSEHFTKTGEPTEAALMVLAEKIGIPDADRAKNLVKCTKPESAEFAANYWRESHSREHLLEFDRARKSMSVVVSTGGAKAKSSQKGTSQKGANKSSENLVLFCKGAAEKVLERCDNILINGSKPEKLTKADRNEIEKVLLAYANLGLRCLALARLDAPTTQYGFTKLEDYPKIESGMTFVGLVGMMDPPRAAVPAAIAECKSAGIRVIVITGDNKKTAEAICRKIGLFADDEDLVGKSFEGEEFQAMSPADQKNAARNANLFSRVEPQHKLKLVSLLKEDKEVVAMTGDGVNDATALQKADIGIAMGSGTSVAKEASKMVLQDDNFSTIVMAVEQGRAIYANTKQFIRYLISSNIGEVACIFLTAALGTPEALIPVQLLWVNLVTDGLPATALGFNKPDADIMKHKPRHSDENIVSPWMFFRYMVIGIYVGIGTVGGYIWWHMYAEDSQHLNWYQITHYSQCAKDKVNFAGVDCSIFHDARASTVSLSVLVTIEMFNALNALSENQSLLVVTPFSNIYVLLAICLSVSLHFMIVYVPFFSNIFHLAPINQNEWYHVILASAPIFLIDEALKFVSRMMMKAEGEERSKVAVATKKKK